MNYSQNTLYALRAMVKYLLGQTIDPPQHTTINERLDIQGTAKPTDTEKLQLGVLIAGNKGHVMVPGVEGIGLTSVKDHLATHSSLFAIMPMCMREVDNDLTLAERQRYCLRGEREKDGIRYYTYSGIWIEGNLADVPVEMIKTTKEPDQPSVEVTYVPTTEDLYPEEIVLPSTGAITTTDVSVGIRALLPVSLNEWFIENYIEAAKILYNGDERYAILSEFALCTSVKRLISVPSTAGNVNFNESIGTQVYAFSADYKAVYYNTQKLDLVFDVGCQIPLIGTESIPTLETIGTDPATQNA